MREAPPDGNAAFVEIRSKHGLPQLLGKVPPKSGVTFPHSHRLYWFFFYYLNPKSPEIVTIYRKYTKTIEKIQVAHPGSNPVIGIATKQGQFGRRSQDAIEDYSESGAEVQVLCLPIYKVVGSCRRVGASR